MVSSPKHTGYFSYHDGNDALRRRVTRVYFRGTLDMKKKETEKQGVPGA